MSRLAAGAESRFSGRSASLRTIIRVLAVVAFAALLAGCDKCGNWFGLGAPFGAAAYGLDACKSTGPQKQ
jgi:hypothetical protein